MVMDMRSAEAGCGQCAVAIPRLQLLKSLRIARAYRFLILILLLLLMLEGCWWFVPALQGQGRAGQGRDLERQERGAFADMGKEHMGISAGGVAYQRSFSRAAFRPLGAASSLSLLPTPTSVCVCVCVYILSRRIHDRLSHQLRCGWPGYIEALRPSTTLCLCNTAYTHTKTHTHASAKALGLCRCLEPQRIPHRRRFASGSEQSWVAKQVSHHWSASRNNPNADVAGWMRACTCKHSKINRWRWRRRCGCDSDSALPSVCTVTCSSPT